MRQRSDYRIGFIPYASAAFLIGIVGGFSTLLGPAFVKDLGLPYNATTWTALAQAMSTAACAPILGKVGDLIGRRPTLLLGIVVFTLGNLLSSLANSLAFMIVSRFLAGIGTAAITPVILAYIVTEFPQDRVAGGFSLYMLISSAAVIFGPTLGSLTIAAYGWRAMLQICSAIGAVTFFLCLAFRRRQTKLPAAQPFDLIGALLVLVFFSLLLLIPSVGQNLGWRSPALLLTAVMAAVSSVGLIGAEKRAAVPILSAAFLRRRAFVLSVLALFLTQGFLQVNMTGTIIFLDHTRPHNAAFSGYAISVLYVGMSLGAVLLGPMADRIEPKKVLVGSLAATGLGCGLLYFYTEATPLFLLMAALGLLGFGLGGNGTIFMKTALSGVPPRQAGAGTGTYGLFRDLASPFGVAVFVPLFTNRITKLTTMGISETQAAVRSIHTLAGIELVCIAGAILTVLFLPNTRTKEN